MIKNVPGRSLCLMYLIYRHTLLRIRFLHLCLSVICYAFSRVRIEMGVGRICGKGYHQNCTHGAHLLFA